MAASESIETVRRHLPPGPVIPAPPPALTSNPPPDDRPPRALHRHHTDPGAGWAKTPPATAPGTSATGTGQTNGTAYDATVAATNTVGTGSAATSNTVTPAGAPFVPTSVAAVGGDSSAVVSWGTPSGNGSPNPALALPVTVT